MSIAPVALLLLGLVNADPAARSDQSQVFASADDERPTRTSVREKMPLAMGFELGWNGLSGVGLNFILRPKPSIALDLGAGLGAHGLKVGGRARYNFIDHNWTPTVGAGIWVGSGVSRVVSLPAAAGTGTLDYVLRPSPFLQVVGGLDYTSDAGFFFLPLVGYAILLNPNNVEILAGIPSADQRAAFDLSYKSGLVVSAAFGWSF